MADVSAAVAGMPVQEPKPDEVRPQSGEPPRIIRVNGEYLSLPGCGNYGEWGEYGLKHAIAYFVDELLQGNFNALPAPHITFGTITMKLWRNGGVGNCYVAYGSSTIEKVPPCPSEWLIDVSSRAEDVELGLLRFAKNTRLQMIVVHFSHRRELYIWKKNDGGYGIAGYGLPPTEELWNWHTHS